MKLTPKQRAKIYREAAEYFAVIQEPYEIGHWGFCGYATSRGFDPDEFIEVEMFALNATGGIWYLCEYNEYGNIIYSHNLRVTALLLSEQIALNPIYK